jgi:hypothetical protein
LEVVDEIMKSKLTCSCIVKSVDYFFELIQMQRVPDTDINEEFLLDFNRFYQRHGEETLENMVLSWERMASHSISNKHLICLLRLCEKYDYDSVKPAVYCLNETDTIEEIVERVEKVVADQKAKEILAKEAKY